MQHITKRCADSLRAFTNDNYGIKLKAAHAHELVAAFFGYKSKNAMLADTLHPLSNLSQAEFIIFDPTPCNTGFVDQRLKDFKYDYLNAFHLADSFYTAIRTEKRLSKKVYVSFREVALHIAEQRLHQRLKMLRINPSSIDWDIDGDMGWWENNGDALLTAEVRYRTKTGELLRDSKYTIHLPPVAANLGYGTPKVDETRYSGQFRNPDFNPDFVVKSGEQL